MDIWQILMTPFSWILKMFCQVFNSYGIALFLFTVIVKILMFPLNLKGKKSMIKMNVVNAQVQEIQKRCGNDKERYNQELQKFYAENNVSPLGGCGWSLLPIVFIYPLYAIIRRPLKYMMWLTESTVVNVAEALGWEGFTVAGTNELILGSMINADNLALAAAAAGEAAANVFVINFNFFGIDLSQVPSLMFWRSDIWTSGDYWGAIGLFLMPLISAALSIVSMLVSQKTNQMNKDQQVKMNWSMMLMGPAISLWIGFSMPAGLCIYWISNSLLGMAQDVLSGRMLRKDYEAAQKELEEQQKKAKEAEKERRRKSAEKKAAAIAAGKSGKKQPESKKKGAEASASREASREGLRTYARGRAYDPNRYPITPYHDINGPAKAKPVEEAEPKKLTEEEKQILAESNPELAAQAAEAERTAEAPEAPAEDGDYEEAYSEEEEQGQTPDDKE